MGRPLACRGETQPAKTRNAPPEWRTRTALIKAAATKIPFFKGNANAVLAAIATLKIDIAAEDGVALDLLKAWADKQGKAA